MTLELQELLAKIRQEADRLHASQPSLSLREAYVYAITAQMMAEAEKLDVTPFQALVVQATEEIMHRTGEIATTRAIAIEIGANEPQVRYQLQKLRDKGIVCNPNGPKSGWATQ